MAEDEISFDPNDIITNIEMVSREYRYTRFTYLLPILFHQCFFSGMGVSFDDFKVNQNFIILS
jgi:hypothetical protein